MWLAERCIWNSGVPNIYFIIDLQQAFTDFDAGNLSRDELQALQDKAAKESIERLEAAGETLVTDGEQRVSSFATYPIVESGSPFRFKKNNFL